MLMTKSPQCEAAMSDNSDNSDDKSPLEKTDDICRDFLRNVCKRGKRCKYRHPDVQEARELGRQREYTFCHDFQNAGCRRSSCKFIHCTREEEEGYKQTGQLPVRLQQAAALGIGVLPNSLPLLRGEVPICKDFLKGECKRSARCKYRHLSALEYDYELRKNTPYRSPTVSTYDYSYSENNFEKYDNGYEQVAQLAPPVPAPAPAPPVPAPPPVAVPPAAKRRRTEFEENNFETNLFDNFRFTVRNPGDYRFLEEENTMLRRKMEEMKNRMSDLAATNEVLLEQNAGYHRVTKNNVVTTGPPVVTVSQVVTPTITPAPSVARPGVGVHPICTATLKQITLSGNTELIVSQQALQSHLPPDMTSQPATMAPPTLNPGSIVPVSISMETITGSIASLAQPTVSMSQTSIPQAQIISGISTPMISYPIMSHTCSSQLPGSSLG